MARADWFSRAVLILIVPLIGASALRGLLRPKVTVVAQARLPRWIYGDIWEFD